MCRLRGLPADMVFDPSGWDNDLGFSPYSGQVQLSRWQCAGTRPTSVFGNCVYVCVCVRACTRVCVFVCVQARVCVLHGPHQQWFLSDHLQRYLWPKSRLAVTKPEGRQQRKVGLYAFLFHPLNIFSSLGYDGTCPIYSDMWFSDMDEMLFHTVFPTCT